MGKLVGDKYGIHRVIEPQGVLTQAALKIDNDMTKKYSNEIICDVISLNIDSASFTQIEEACGGDIEQIKEMIGFSMTGLVIIPDNIFTQAEKIEILRIGRRGQPGQPQYTLQYRAAMETALFRIDVQNTLFAFGQMCTVVQYLFPRQ